MKIINKVAFLVHEPTLFTHYSSVWAEMKHADFVIVLLYNFNAVNHGIVPGAKIFIDKIVELGYEFQYFDDVLRHGFKYKYVVSNHKISGQSCKPSPIHKRFKTKVRVVAKHALNFTFRLCASERRYQVLRNDPVQYRPLQIGIYQIRFMYGADIGDGWSLQGWNEIYDLFLCHGPNDEEQLRKRFRGTTAIMGYPRYDRYFSSDLDVSNIIKEFKISNTKKTILWMPTLGEGACSIPHYAKAVSGLFSDYNVIVRPHPISFRDEPQNIDLLRSLSYVIDSDATRDMNELFKIADVVLCDYGGSAFGAIYLDKMLILLDVPGSESYFTVVNSSNLELREYLPIIKPTEAHRLMTLIEDDKQWKTQEGNRRVLFDKYFADYRGSSSHKAAEILSNLDSIIGM